ncbi:MAG: type II secretion system protein [Candidatus Omnitrophota bacterium]
MKRSYTLTELMVVLIIIGVLAILAIPLITGPREQAMDNEAKVNLKLIQAAEKIYHMEYNQYWPAADNDALNQNLTLSLPKATNNNRNWNYSATSDGSVGAVRYSGSRTWNLSITESEPVKTFP